MLQGRVQNTTTTTTTTLTNNQIPPTLRVRCDAMPYLEGSYTRSNDVNGRPSWVNPVADEEGVTYCVYSDGAVWKLCEHSEEHMAKGMCAFKAACVHEEDELPHQMTEGWLRPPVSEGESGLVNDSAISVLLPHALSGIGPYPIGAKVKTVSKALLATIVEDYEVDHVPVETVPHIASRSGTVTRHEYTPNSAYIVATAADGEVLPRLPSLAFSLQ